MNKLYYISGFVVLIILGYMLYQYYNKPTNNILAHIPENIIDKYFIHNRLYNPHVPLPNDKIFVSIASYRDPQLFETLSSLITMCDHPEKLSVVICEQNDPSDTFSMKEFIANKCVPTIITMNSKDARGPCWARYLIQQHWEGEQYYLQIDSHTRFVQSWDTKLRQDIKTLPEKSCLSNYVSTYDIKTGQVEKSPLRGPMYVTDKQEKDKFIRFNSKYVDKEAFDKPQPSKGWSGCFSFSSSQIIIDAPYDPYVPFLFFGEEMDIYLRLYTRGWKMFVPSIPICFTLFDRSYRKTFWEHPDYKNVVNYSRMRLYDRFGWLDAPDVLRQDNDKYCLGNKKTIKER